MLLTSTLFLARTFGGYHPMAALVFYLVATAICVGVLMAVANARGRSSFWSLLGLWLLPGLLIGLLILIAMPSSSPPITKAA